MIKIPLCSGPSLKPEPLPRSLSLRKSLCWVISLLLICIWHNSIIFFILHPLGPIIFLAILKSLSLSIWISYLHVNFAGLYGKLYYQKIRYWAKKSFITGRESRLGRDLELGPARFWGKTLLNIPLEFGLIIESLESSSAAPPKTSSSAPGAQLT